MGHINDASFYVEMRMTRRLWTGVVVVLVIYLILQSRQLLGKLQNPYAIENNNELFVRNVRKNAFDEHVYQNPGCRPKTNIAFVKTHKTGSTTVMNVIQRFGYYRNLTFVLPRGGLVYLGSHRLTLNSWSILPHPSNKSFNILCNHVVYNKEKFQKFLPKDTVYVTILRQPFQRFLSAFWYYSHVHPQDYLLKIKGDNKVRTFLENPLLYENGVQYTHNAMSTDLGLSPVNFYQRSNILRYIRDIDNDFSLVVILELFDESLILLKRKLCWSLKDILYLPKNEGSDHQLAKDYNGSINDKDIQRHRDWDGADYYFYNHFHTRLLQRINSEGPGFFEEVLLFKKTRMAVSDFCQGGSGSDTTATTTSGPKDKIDIFETQYNEAFSVSRQECELLLIRSEEKFTRILIHKQYPNLKEIIEQRP